MDVNKDTSQFEMSILQVELSSTVSIDDAIHCFCLQVDGEEQYFQLRSGDKKRFMLPRHASYQIKSLKNQEALEYEINPSQGIISGKKSKVHITQYCDKSKITIDIQGQILWEYDDEVEVEVPESVWVGLKDLDGKIISKKEIHRDIYDRWIYEFKVPKYDQNGHELSYALCQENLEHYETVVIGKNIKNIIYTPVDYVVNVKYIPSKKCLGQKRIQLEYGEDHVSRENLTVDVEREGVYHLGPIQFFKPGVYLYDVVLYEEECIKDISSVMIEVGKNDFDLEVLSVEYIQEDAFKESRSLVFDCRCIAN